MLSLMVTSVVACGMSYYSVFKCHMACLIPVSTTMISELVLERVGAVIVLLKFIPCNKSKNRDLLEPKIDSRGACPARNQSSY